MLLASFGSRFLSPPLSLLLHRTLLIYCCVHCWYTLTAGTSLPCVCVAAVTRQLVVAGATIQLL